MSILTLKNVNYQYKTKYVKVNAVQNISYTFEAGITYAIVGRSGSGKTTLLSLMAGLDVADNGEILYNGQNLAQLDRTKYRREEIGIIYQSFHLFPLLTAVENVAYPLENSGIKHSEAHKKAKALLLTLGFTERHFKQLPNMMSGGEQQRVAIARALSMSAKVLLADEPTGNLDNENSDLIIETLTKLAKESNCCVIIITHDLAIAEKCDVIVKISDGRIV